MAGRCWTDEAASREDLHRDHRRARSGRPRRELDQRQDERHRPGDVRGDPCACRGRSAESRRALPVELDLGRVCREDRRVRLVRYPGGALGHGRGRRGERLHPEAEARAKDHLQLRRDDGLDVPRVEHIPARRRDGAARGVRTDDARGGGVGRGLLRRQQRPDCRSDHVDIELALRRRVDSELRVDADQLPGDGGERCRACARVSVARRHRSDRVRPAARDRVVLVPALHDEIDAGPRT